MQRRLELEDRGDASLGTRAAGRGGVRHEELEEPIRVRKGGKHLMRDAIRGPQRSSEVLRGNQSSSEAITLWASTRSSSRASSSETQSRRAEIVSRSVEGCSNSVRRYRLPAAVLHCAHRDRRRGEHLHAQGYGLSPSQRHSEAFGGACHHPIRSVTWLSAPKRDAFGSPVRRLRRSSRLATVAGSRSITPSTLRYLWKRGRRDEHSHAQGASCFRRM